MGKRSEPAEPTVPNHRLTIRVPREEAIRVTRVSIKSKSLCYFLVADKAQPYGKKRSKIVYIGTTEKGVVRIARSIGGKADKTLGLRGVKTFQVRVVTCKDHEELSTAKMLERCLLLAFREYFGSTPKFNVQGKGFKEADAFEWFRRKRVLNIIRELS
jgi:hypothetical protein